MATLQRKVKLPDDAIFGSGTEAAVKRFQRDHGLTPDGIVGAHTWRELDKE